MDRNALEEGKRPGVGVVVVVVVAKMLSTHFFNRLVLFRADRKCP